MTDLTNPIFNDADKAREHLEALRWPNGAVCPHCGATDHLVTKVETTGKQTKEPKKGKHRPPRAGLHYCNSCKEQFTVTVGTVLEKSHVPLNKWLMAFYLMCASKKGYSAHQLHRTISVSYKTAWFMAHRIRLAMAKGGLMPQMGGSGGAVEIDETFIGSKAGTPKAGQKPAAYQHKHAILTLVERSGEARSFHIDTAKSATIIPIVRANVAKDSFVLTDEAKYYHWLKSSFDKHGTVHHTIGEYGRGEINTNSVEGFFSIFKRGMRGVYQHCSEKHLHRYLAEFDFRYSNRIKLGVNDTERTFRAIKGAEGKRLTYRRARRAEDRQGQAPA